MTQFCFDNLLLPTGWAENVLVDVDDAGWISAVASDTDPAGSAVHVPIGLPGIPNCHSHAFQRAMAGLTETRGNSDDSFWTWRDLMYRFVDRIRPEDLMAIAAQAYMEMLESGFTSVAEFHYLHHAANRQPYDNIAEMSASIFQAAGQSGIGLTLLPVFYESSGFGGAEPGEAQGRFANTRSTYGQLLEKVTDMAGNLPDAVVGMAPHSLRAVTPEGLNEILSLPCTGPVHIHIAEQTREVEDCLAWSGRRPVSWLFENVPVDARWCLIHATHLDDGEISLIATSKAVAGLCPITEANLGDGIFEGVSFLNQQGRIAIGSDSNVLISVAEELRLLEYSQRLRDQGRNRLTTQGRSNGRNLFEKVLTGGAQASGRKISQITPGHRADFVSLDPDHSTLLSRSGDAWLDGWIFAADKSIVRDVWVGGKQVVQNCRHRDRDAISQAYATALAGLLGS
jgi:formimidoylglutamate deiminase